MAGSRTASKQTRASVSRFLSNIMEPLARIVMRYGYSAREASDVVRWSFVRSFFSTPEFWAGERPTFVQGAIKTGLPRQQVKQLNALPAPERAIFAYRQNLAYRVVEGWVNDAEFHHDGEPAPLPITHRSGPSFNKLVMKYGNDVTYSPVLKDLESAGCVRVEGSEVVLVSPTYGMHFLDEDKLKIAEHMVRQLVQTTDHNLCHTRPSQRRLQRFWFQNGIPSSRASEAMTIATRIAVDAGRRIDLAMAKFANEGMATEPRVEIGIGMYLYKNPDDHVGETGKSENQEVWK